MKILYTGGVKSGKSRHAEQRCLELAETEIPIYLATTEFIDAEIQKRIDDHQTRRQGRFLTCEEPLKLALCIESHSVPVLIECLTMWLNNMLHHHRSESEIFDELSQLLQLPNNMVLVINEVGLGVIPDNPLARQFVDLSGKVSQWVGEYCDEIYFCIAGHPMRVK